MTDAAEPHIRIIENGPYLVSGGPLLTRRAPAMSTHGEPLDQDLVGAKDVNYEMRDECALCRCGQPKNKPFCDGAHKEAGFRAPQDTQTSSEHIQHGRNGSGRETSGDRL